MIEVHWNALDIVEIVLAFVKLGFIIAIFLMLKAIMIHINSIRSTCASLEAKLGSRPCIIEEHRYPDPLTDKEEKAVLADKILTMTQEVVKVLNKQRRENADDERDSHRD